MPCPTKATAHRVLCIVATALVSLINPIGYKLLLFPFHVTADQFVMNRVAEFLSPNFHEVLPFKYMFLAMLVSLALARSRSQLQFN